MSLPRDGAAGQALSPALLPPTPSSSKQKPRPLSHMGPRASSPAVLPGAWLLNPCGGKQQPPLQTHEFLSYPVPNASLMRPSLGPAWSGSGGSETDQLSPGLTRSAEVPHIKQGETLRGQQ